MQFKVPQDVQREDTIIGPVTLKQMGILGAGGGLAYVLYVILAKKYYIEIWLPPVLIVSGLTLAFAFLKIHSMKFHTFLMNFIEYHLLPRKRFWVLGSGNVFISSFEKDKKDIKAKIEEKTIKDKKTIEELSQIVDREKKEGLQKIINQNYKNPYQK